MILICPCVKTLSGTGRSMARSKEKQGFGGHQTGALESFPKAASVLERVAAAPVWRE